MLLELPPGPSLACGLDAASGFSSDMMQEVHLGDCQRLRVCYVSGEALPPSTVQKFTQRLPRAQLHNLYGPTEATVDVTGVKLLHL